VNDRFTDRTVFITGAGSGIGLQMALQFMAEGAKVYSADRDTAGCAEGTVKVLLDVTDEAQIIAGLHRAVEETGRLDVLCNNAGASSITDPLSCTAEEWDQVFAVNARGVFLGTKHALPAMLAQGSGCIINTASAAGLIGLKDRTAYCASKGAVIALTKQVAVQYAGTGVRCNCVCPGTVDSPWVGRLLEQAEDAETARAALVARQPLGRLGTPKEVAAAVLYLASDDASFITGTELVIDGGIVAG
jgi:NAD(P)-dependent dehydrogenase (short-subunit alcohol dehydrogenase family)